jgi:hypothetical protein
MPDLGIGREYFYRQINRLDYVNSEGLDDIPNEAGLYAVFQEGEKLVTQIVGLPEDTLRCVKIGMSKKSLKKRLKQFIKGNHNGYVARMHIGDALIGKAIANKDQEFLSIKYDNLENIRSLWNINSISLKKMIKDNICKKISDLKINNVKQLQQKFDKLEQEVNSYLKPFKFIIIPCSQKAITQVEDKANSFLRDTTTEYDYPSELWLGRYSSNETIRQYGLWAVDGVQDAGRHKYLPYVNHPADRNYHNENDEAIADWLGSLKGIIDQTENN